MGGGGSWEFPNLVVLNLVVFFFTQKRSFAPLRSFAPFCALLRFAFALFCTDLRSFARICVFLHPTAFRTTAFGNCRGSAEGQGWEGISFFYEFRGLGPGVPVAGRALQLSSNLGDAEMTRFLSDNNSRILTAHCHCISWEKATTIKMRLSKMLFFLCFRPTIKFQDGSPVDPLFEPSADPPFWLDLLASSKPTRICTTPFE